MMSIRISCRRCQAVCSVPETLVGKNVRCPKCEEVFRVPREEPVVAAEKEGVVTLEVASAADIARYRPAKQSKSSRSSSAKQKLDVDDSEFGVQSFRLKRGTGSPPWWIVGGIIAGAFVLVMLVVSLVIWNGLNDARQAIQPLPLAPRPGVEEPEEKLIVPIAPVAEPEPPKPSKEVPAPRPVEENVSIPFELKPCPIQGDQEERKLPGRAGDIVLGGGGRFVIVSIPESKKIAIFDVNQAEFVKYLPMDESDVFLAAGMEKLFICLPVSQRIQRWSLRTFERESSDSLPLLPRNDPVKAACMGWASDGPLLLLGLRQSLFVHPLTMQPLPLPLRIADNRFSLGARPSGDGATFICMPTTDSVRVHVVGGGVTTNRDRGKESQSAAMGADGSFFCTMIGVYSDALTEIYPKGNSAKLSSSPYVPAKQGQFFFRIGQGRNETIKNFNFFIVGHARPFAVMPNFVGFNVEKNVYSGSGGRLAIDRRYLLLPESNVLVALPAEDDRLILKKFDVRELLAKSSVDYLVVTSTPPRVAKRGAMLQYQVTAFSKNDGLTYRLKSGPPKMTISPEGKLSWAVPVNFAASIIDVSVMVANDSGQETLHNFRSAVRD